jgi:DNA-binding NarL/FixJ family response regulator
MDKKLHLMVVDDNPWARKALMAFISTREGMTITAEASNGLEAIDSIKNQIPDVVLMDLQMPVMDGIDATRVIKNRWPHIKIIAITMYPNYQPEAVSAGADAFLVKGCPVDEMTSTILSVTATESI